MKIVYIDMDDVLTDFSTAVERALKENSKIGFPQSQYGFFQSLEPIPNAINSVNLLRQSDRYEVYILTAPSVRNPLSYTEKRVWIENHFDYELAHRLIISPNKSLLRGDYLIDDNNSGKGQEAFQGQLLHFGSPKFPDWKSMLKALGEVKGK